MGIKGRRKKLRQQAEAEAARAAEAVPDGDLYGDEDDEFDDFGDDGAGDDDGDGTRGMKLSDRYLLADATYLEEAREQHAARREPNRKKARTEGGGGAKSKKQAPHAKHDQHATPSRHAGGGGEAAEGVAMEGALMRGAATSREQRKKAVEGPPFASPFLELHPALVRALHAEGFARMTPIQARAVPLVLQGFDVLGQAATGSGKTLAFVVPMLHETLPTVAASPNAFVGLIVSPTKELCAQIRDVTDRVCRHLDETPFRVELVTGGTNVKEERRRVLASNVVVGTPGRVVDHVKNTPQWSLRTTTKFFVLDEADKMLADGFALEVDSIVGALPPQRRTLLFSATNNKSVRELARLSLSGRPLLVNTTDPAPVRLPAGGDGGGARRSSAYVGLDALDENDSAEDEEGLTYVDLAANVEEDEEAADDGEDGEEEDDDGDFDGGDEEAEEVDDARAAAAREAAGHVPSQLQQYYQLVPVADRLRVLYLFVKRLAQTAKAIVFCSTVASAEYHCMLMGAAGFHNEVLMLHGKMKHRQRLATFECFLKWPTGVLFCTDVAARGLDIPDVDWILQYDPPTDPTEYVHRIGRTARAGAQGSALLFVAPEEQAFVAYLHRFGLNVQPVAAPRKLPPVQAALEHVLEEDPIVAKAADRAYRAHLAAYQSHVLKKIFDVHRLDLIAVGKSFALTTPPAVTLPKNTVDEKQREYVKGKLRSLNKRAAMARKDYDRLKTMPQWTDEGQFVGFRR